VCVLVSDRDIVKSKFAVPSEQRVATNRAQQQQQQQQWMDEGWWMDDGCCVGWMSRHQQELPVLKALKLNAITLVSRILCCVNCADTGAHISND
jgi:hypothetical protein